MTIVGALLAKRELMSSFKGIVTRNRNVRLAKPLPDPVQDFSLFFLRMRNVYISVKKIEQGAH